MARILATGLFDPGAGPEGAWTAMAVEGAPSPRGEHMRAGSSECLDIGATSLF